MISIVKQKTASFDVDPQNGFTEKCPNELPVTNALEIVPFLNDNATFSTIRVASKDWHNPNSVWIATTAMPQYSKVGLPNSDIRWNGHCFGGTLGAEFIEGLPRPLEYDFVVYKGLENDTHPYGACFHDLSKTRSTGVIEFLKSHDINTVIVGGLATDYCVKETVLELRGAGFTVILNLSACRGISEDTVDMAISEMQGAGVLVIENTSELQIV